jgi:hypothetical protein
MGNPGRNSLRGCHHAFIFDVSNIVEKTTALSAAIVAADH